MQHAGLRFTDDAEEGVDITEAVGGAVAPVVTEAVPGVQATDAETGEMIDASETVAGVVATEAVAGGVATEAEAGVRIDASEAEAVVFAAGAVGEITGTKGEAEVDPATR